MWLAYTKELCEVLSQLAVTDGTGLAVDAGTAFSRWTDMAVGLDRNASIFLIGNGASASMASHFSADITKNCGIRASVFTDCSLITALGNDEGFENAFAVAIGRYGREGDLMVAISSSGNSPNVLRACDECRRIGVSIVTLSGKQPDNNLRRRGDLNFYIPGRNYSLAESAHGVIMHHWIDRLESVFRSGQSCT